MGYESSKTYLLRGAIIGFIYLLVAGAVGVIFKLPLIGWNYLPVAVQLDTHRLSIYLLLLLGMTIFGGYLATTVVERIR